MLRIEIVKAGSNYCSAYDPDGPCDNRTAGPRIKVEIHNGAGAPSIHVFCFAHAEFMASSITHMIEDHTKPRELVPMSEERIKEIEQDYWKREQYAISSGDNNSEPPEYIEELISALRYSHIALEPFAEVGDILDAGVSKLSEVTGFTVARAVENRVSNLQLDDFRRAKNALGKEQTDESK